MDKKIKVTMSISIGDTTIPNVDLNDAGDLYRELHRLFGQKLPHFAPEPVFGTRTNPPFEVSS